MTAHPKRSGQSAIRYVLALALGLRLGLPLVALAVAKDGPLVREPDSEGYVRLAEELADSGRFARQGKPELARTPGYPLFLLAGVLVGHTDLVTIVLQSVVGCLTVYLVFHSALVLFERAGTALGCALLQACEPLSVLYAGKLLTDTLFASLTAAFLFFLLRYLRRGGGRDLVISATALAGSIYVRPISYFLPALLTLFLCACLARRIRQRPRLAVHLGGFFLLSMGLAGAWQARNYVQARYAGFAAISDENLYFYQGAAVLAAQRGRPLAEVQKELGYSSQEVYYRRHPEQRGWTDGRRYAYLRREGTRIISSDPWTYLKIHLAGMRGTMSDIGMNAYLGFFGLDTRWAPAAGPKPGLLARLESALAQKPAMLAAYLVLRLTLIAYLALGLVGLLSKGMLKNVSVWALLVVAAYLVLLSGGPAGYHRFRLPVVPMMSLLAGCGLSNVWAKCSSLAARARIRPGGPPSGSGAPAGGP